MYNFNNVRLYNITLQISIQFEGVTTEMETLTHIFLNTLDIRYNYNHMINTHFIVARCFFFLEISILFVWMKNPFN